MRVPFQHVAALGALMTTVLPPAGPWNQLANACFFLSALVSDLLVLRCLLFMAYVFLLSGAITGYPSWPNWGWQDVISVDGISWASLVLLFHGYAIWRHLWDERHISFRSENEEQLWRFFYRRCGMFRMEMHECLKFGCWHRYCAGDVIVHPWTSRIKLHLVIEGLVELDDTCEVSTKHSGTIFDFGVANIFGVYLGFDCSDEKGFTARAKTDCLLYEWTVEDLEKISNLSPAIAAFWRSFVLCEVGMQYAAHVHPQHGRRAADGKPELPEFEIGERSRDFLEQLREDEVDPPLGVMGHFWAFLRLFDPFPPPGLRHSSQPMSGVIARNRLFALAEAKMLERRAESLSHELPAEKESLMGGV